MGSRAFLSLPAAFAAVLIPSIGLAASDADVDALRAELAALKNEYAARVGALEARINQLEASDASTPVQSAEPAAPAPSPSGSASAFNPAISVILTGNYANLSQDPADYHIAGFMPPEEGVGPGDRNFNLGESELTLSANVDPYFMGALTVAVTGENEIEVEEAYFRTLALPQGFTLKGGQFFSGIGYLNEIHAHAWDFIDQPLVYQAFFGGQMAQVGLQARWLAPADVFLEFGAETGSGQFFPGTREDSNSPNGVALFAHAGSDIGESIAWRAGLSWVDLDAEDRSFEGENGLEEPTLYAFTGSSRTWVLDATLKWTRPGDTKRRYLKLQGEYMDRTEDGSLSYAALGATLDGRYRASQSGWYLQGVYQFLPRWRAGARYDSMDSGDTAIGLVQSGELGWADFALLAPASPSRTTLMLDWNLSEFSRLRAQYAWDDARDATTDEQLFLQYIHALGAHGAHKF
jgi:hypothetical protein